LAKFKDRENKEWAVDVTAGHLKPLREDFGIDLRDALKPEDNSLAAVLSDPEKFGQVLWVFCGPQAEKAGIGPEDFAFRFDGETIERAATALWQAVWDFFRPRTGDKAATAFRTGLAKMTAGTNEAWDKVNEFLTSKSFAGNSEGRPGSATTEPTPSAS
jgi:hypothetical protein